MSTDQENFNGTPPLTELVEEAPVTRASYLANTFAESFFERFAEAELADEKKFLLDVAQLDRWMVEHNLMPDNVDENDELAQRGKAMIRNTVRRTINRAAAYGNVMGSPFSIEVYEPGRLYEVRLLEYFAEKLPAEFAERTLKFIVNKGTNWGHITAYMHSEAVEKRLQNAPDVRTRFLGTESSIRLTFRNITAQLENLNEEMNSTYREARRLVAAAAKTG